MKRLYVFLIFVSTLVAQTTQAQNANGSIAGSVKTSDGKPASYVSVGLDRTNKGTTTDEDGHYTITDIQPGSYSLKVSFVGLATQEQKVEVGRQSVTRQDFILAESENQLNEVLIVNSNSNNRPVSLGKMDIRPLDLPQSMGVIPSKVIVDQQAVRLGDVVKNVSGVSLTQSRNGVAETFSARGYSIGIAGSGGSIFKNGVIANTQGFPDASTLESIEVLKGSSALLYGNVSGGVIINMVTKKPVFNWGGKVSMLTGSYNQYKPTIDVYGPISKNLAFRVVGTHENAKSYRDVVKANRTFINPSLLYKLSSKTELLVQADYLKSDIVPDAGVGIPNSRITITEVPDARRNRFIYPNWAYNNTKQTSASINISHRFNERWKIVGIGALQRTAVNGFGVGVPNSIAANGDWNRSLSAVKTGERNYTGQINMNGNFRTGRIQHQLLVGSDFVRIVTENNSFKYTSATGVVGTAYDKINIFDPVTFNLRTDIPTVADTALTTTPQNRFGVYFQDLISVTSKFKVLAGLRWSTQKAFQTTILNQETQIERRGTNANKTDAAFSPKIALIYQPIQNSSIYGSYTNSFTVNSGTDIYGDNLKPSLINQFEVGVKNEFLDGRLSANVSVYRIINSNFAQTALFDQNGNPNTNSNLKELSGETTSDGFEMDINATLSRHFYFMAGYGYNFMRYTQTTGAVGSQVEGQRLINNPAHTANGTLFYTFDQGAVKGLKLGASGFFTGKRFGGNNNVVGLDGGFNNTTASQSSYNAQVPLTGFTTFDLSAGYTWNRISLLVKVSNIFNTMNYIVHDRYSINPIPPRMFAATLGYKF